MRVRELRLQGYRAHLDPPAFAFGDRFTVIAGINGRGKTAILDGLAVLFSRFLPLVSPSRDRQRGLSYSDVVVGQRAAELRVKLNCAGIPVEFGVEYDTGRRRIRSTQLAPAVREEILRAYGDRARADDAAPLAVYYTTDRAGYRLSRTLPAEVPRGQAAAYTGALSSRRVDFRDFMARYRASIEVRKTDAERNPNFLGTSVATAIATALETFLGGFTNLRVQNRPLRLLVDKDAVTLDLSQLSDGERSFIALICDLSRRLALANPLLPDPLMGAGVVLIDELELHLHPKWQLTVIENLRTTFPNVQFVGTTHSPFILQTAREGEVINLDGAVPVEPASRTIEEVVRLVMGVVDTERSPRHQRMLEAARDYLALVEEAKDADESRRAEIRVTLQRLLAPFSDNPAYTALLERRGVLEGDS